MTTILTCGHEAEFDENLDEYTNACKANWKRWEIGEDGWYEADCYGLLCHECMERYGARELDIPANKD